MMDTKTLWFDVRFGELTLSEMWGRKPLPGSGQIKRGSFGPTHSSAIQIHSLLKRLFSFGIVLKYRTDNPAAWKDNLEHIAEKSKDIHRAQATNHCRAQTCRVSLPPSEHTKTVANSELVG
jgi:hypothetical protein